MPVNVNEIELDEKIIEIEMERRRPFRNHPFNHSIAYTAMFLYGAELMEKECTQAVGDLILMIAEEMPFTLK